MHSFACRGLLRVGLALLLLAGLSLAAAQPAPETVRIGVLAKRGEAQTLARWGATADYLEGAVPGFRFRIVPLDFDEVAGAVERGEVEFLLANSSFYVEMEVRYGISRIATLRNRLGERSWTRFGGVVFTRADAPPVERLAALRGRSFMAVDATSLGGFQAAWRELSAAGVDPVRDFAPLRFGGTHDAVVYAVRDGLVDVGTVRTDTLERMAAEGKIRLDDFRVLHPVVHADFGFLVSTRLYPEWPLARLRHTPEEVSHAVATALLRMPPDSAAAQAAQVAGWTIPRNYQPVHELMRDLHIGPYEHLGEVRLRDVLAQYWYWLVVAAAALFALSMANAYVTRLNQRLRRSEEALREARDGLAIRVRERTAELERTLKDLQESHRRLDLVRRDWNDAFDAIADAIFIHDAEMRIVHANPAYVARTGLAADEVVGRPYHEVFPRLERPLAACRAFPERQDEEEVGEEIVLADGTVLVSRSFGIRRADGSVEHAIHILKDVTAERRAESRRRTLARAVEQAGEGVLVLGADRRVAYANPALCALSGRSEAELSGGSVADLVPEPVLGQVQALAQGGDEHWSGELELCGPDRCIPTFATASVLRGEHGQLRGFVLTVLDLRQVKAAESQLRYRIGFESVIAGIAASFVPGGSGALEQGIAEALRTLGEFVDCGRAILFAHEAAGDRLLCRNEWAARGVGPNRSALASVPMQRFAWCAGTLDGGEAVLVPDAAELPDEAAELRTDLRRRGVLSLVLVPLISDQRLLGLLAFEDVEARRAWPREDVNLLRTAGELIAGALRRSQVEEAVQRSEASLAQAQRIARLGNWDWNIVTNGLYWSDEIYRIFGVEPHQFGATYDAFLGYVHPDDREPVREAVRQALERERDYTIDHRIVLADGSERIVHEMGQVEFRNGHPVRMVGTVQDVTEERRAERELRRLNRALRTLSRGNSALVHAADEDELLRAVCDVLVEVGGFRFAWVGYAESGPERAIRPQARAGTGDGFLDGLALTWADDGDTAAGAAIRTARAVVMRDLGNDPRAAGWWQQALAQGFRSLAALPLCAGKEAYGALVIYADEPAVFDRKEMELLNELAADLAFGIASLRARAERKRALEALAASEQRYHGLYESAPNAYFSARLGDGALLHFNHTLPDLLGYEHAELAALSLRDLVADGRGAEALFAAMARGEGVRDRELAMRHRDGSDLWLSLSADPVRDADGAPVEMRASLIDISPRMQAQQERRKLAEQLQRSLLQTIKAIALTIEKRDPYTAGHQQRVAELAVAIAREMGIDEQRSEGLRLAALIHDIGKIYVPTEILNRPGDLDAVQYQLLKTHPQVGYEILKGIEFPWPLADIVVQHHEHLDGSGYPKGLSGEAVLLEARILTVADVVEAMASHRPYRPSRGLEEALAAIEAQSGRWYDPDVVRACLHLFREQGFGWDGLPGHGDTLH